MNSLIFIQEKKFTKLKSFSCSTFVSFLALIMFVPSVQAEWGIDLSRRTKEIRKSEYDQPENVKKDKSIFDTIFESSEPIQEVVVLNTERGFVPRNLRIRSGRRYRIHVVNINPKNKNVSFVLDSFSEHHATYYGKMRSFLIEPKTTGVFSFQCPETSAKGKLVVYPPAGVTQRLPASRQ